MEVLTLHQQFPYNLEAVMAARARRYEDIERFPELKGQRVLEEKTENQVKFTKRLLSIGDKIPDLFKKLVPPEKLQMIEESYFALQDNINNFQVYLDGHKDKMTIQGRTEYRAEGDGRSTRTYKLEFRVNVPFVGSMLAGQLRAQYEKGLHKDYDVLMQLLKEG